MRTRYLAFLTLLSTIVFLSLTHGQDPRTPPMTPPVVPATYKDVAPAAPTTPAPALPTPTPSRDLAKLTDTQKQALITAQRGAMWLYNMNAASGHFYYGFLPALNRPIEGDNYFHQVAAAATLARAARITGEARFNARASQAILALLDETVVDPKDPKVRYTAMPSIARNRLATAGLLVAAIHELPSPQADLLDKSEQLCNFIHRQARPNGSLCLSDSSDEGTPPKEPADALTEYPGLALYGLMLSQRQHPATWKTDLARKAVAYYHPLWQANKTAAFIPAQTAAYTEAYLLTKEPEFAKCVFEMNDWLVKLQYEAPRVTWWYGGFKAWKDGHEVEEAPTISHAVYGESLVNACRVASASGDLDRHKSYSPAVERHLLFLASLQYTLANTRHFDAPYRELLSGGFYASQQDGNLRLDYTQQAVAVLLQYVEQVR
jgi:hypothetical protein